MQIEKRATRPRASMHEECDLAAVRESAFQASFVFLPQVNSETISHDVVIFTANGVGVGAAVGGHDCARDQDQNQKRETTLHWSQHHFIPPHE
jgi:hypothetical protein